MLQIFTTQLSGKMKMVKDTYEDVFEDCSRILAQSIISGHTIYLFATGEMKCVLPQALYGNDRFENVKLVEDANNVPTLKDQDSFLIFAPSSLDESSLKMARLVAEQNNSIMAVIGNKGTDQSDKGLEELVDLTINLQVHSMVPQDDGSRIGTPVAVLALYVYHCLHLTIVDILAEYE
ncbi:hypothetical protein BTR23_03250 [Alkalihalophilus pseudofirmus]|nr:hypothetical protein BTR23_03250 [Alkalihalophilus pseudofirmus]